MSALLTVEGLSVGADSVELVHDLSFTIGPGERVGLIGESGSGKSLTALSLMGLLPEGVVASGTARLGGRDLVGVQEARVKRLRGSELSMVFQEPMTALNPLMRVGAQVAEVMTLHGRSRQDARQRAVELLARVRLPEPAEIARAYPHQLSGGQRQRVMLAIALANEPRLLICDEPTTALDVTVQKQMLELIAEVAPALLFITHDLAVVASVCERVLVMYGGRVVESGPVREVFTHPRHRYTEGLLAASRLTPRGTRLPTISGSVPAAGRFPSGCVFRNRCPHATPACETAPALTGDGHAFACWHPAG
ncbi:oligopeptide/dipeptide ABC transporter, ATP-binding protein, C-terminal domain-containing protein [Nonomuraea maritima]|uniref:Oligopeptide/dipeptide ABC transporter, ATP-binding protein, C-terminal domain-containing protein n=1 Tax=Nonomuraea maritima TaxID=683260 RepID=A0A1G8WVI9_9ACTN|nr:ABC transporter ATP-binding protein [Nonomuraea maritima]SDJ82077.1 oligopeptide/dipeptide ABC transporter, ATP-binding protein, C-terminal domain-containing protein [Nonomuraea maritima]